MDPAFSFLSFPGSIGPPLYLTPDDAARDA